MSFQIYLFFSAYFFCKLLEHPEQTRLYEKTCVIFFAYFFSIAIFTAIT